MLGVLEGLSGVVAAAMAGDLGLSVEDADAGGAGEQGERLADVGVGNRVGIAVEADVGGFARADGADEGPRDARPLYRPASAGRTSGAGRR